MRTFISALFILSLSACKFIPGTDASKAEAARLAVTAELKDPTSAIFSEVKVVTDGVCGKVNGKNSYGAYSGSNRFVWREGHKTLIEGASNKNPGIEAMDACELERLYNACEAGRSLLQASVEVDSSGQCIRAGNEAIEDAYGLKRGQISRH